MERGVGGGEKETRNDTDTGTDPAAGTPGCLARQNGVDVTALLSGAYSGLSEAEETDTQEAAQERLTQFERWKDYIGSASLGTVEEWKHSGGYPDAFGCLR